MTRGWLPVATGSEKAGSGYETWLDVPAELELHKPSWQPWWELVGPAGCYGRMHEVGVSGDCGLSAATAAWTVEHSYGMGRHRRVLDTATGDDLGDLSTSLFGATWRLELGGAHVELHGHTLHNDSITVSSDGVELATVGRARLPRPADPGADDSTSVSLTGHGRSHPGGALLYMLGLVAQRSMNGR